MANIASKKNAQTYAEQLRAEAIDNTAQIRLESLGRTPPAQRAAKIKTWDLSKEYTSGEFRALCDIMLTAENHSPEDWAKGLKMAQDLQRKGQRR